MLVMCLNAWGGRLHDQLLPYVVEKQPDILCLQEVVHTPSSNKPWLTYRDHLIELKQRARFFEDVCAALPDHNAMFCPAAQGDLWDGDIPFPSQWGLATFVRKSIPIIGQLQNFVHKEFSANGYGQHPRSRNAHVIRLFDLEKEWPVTIAHMHGLRDLNGKNDTPERISQARRLCDLTQSISEDTDRVVVCGDFNVLPGSATFTELAQIGLFDLVTKRGFSSTRSSHYKKPDKFADYLFVNDPLKEAPFKVDYEREVSDHCPLMIDIC